MKSLYSRNQSVLKDSAQFISDNNITKFRTQNALYCMIEDIKNPFLTNRRHSTQPSYVPQHNYQPIVNHLIALGILSKHKHPGNWNSRVEYTVNKFALESYILFDATKRKA